ncbi:MAG: hypothetical protein J7J06_00420 [Methanosarcinales archaeon]|nr:hypothetical protein [Methanosarcinales archaeon]
MIQREFAGGADCHTTRREAARPVAIERACQTGSRPDVASGTPRCPPDTQTQHGAARPASSFFAYTRIP